MHRYGTCSKDGSFAQDARGLQTFVEVDWGLVFPELWLELFRIGTCALWEVGDGGWQEEPQREAD